MSPVVGDIKDQRVLIGSLHLFCCRAALSVAMCASIVTSAKKCNNIWLEGREGCLKPATNINKDCEYFSLLFYSLKCEYTGIFAFILSYVNN